MEPKVIERLMKQLGDSINEVKILYDLDDVDLAHLTYLIMFISKSGMAPLSAAKVLKATAHHIENTDDIVMDAIRKMR